MEYRDANNNPMKPGAYFETFYKGEDEFRNRIVWITPFGSNPQRYVIIKPWRKTSRIKS